ncbi:MAG: amidohydrolase family protein [Bacteroidales bacterium]|nr:amidohydrolase family protein [Bacteroidales bacterium]
MKKTVLLILGVLVTIIAQAQELNDLKLKDYRPRSIYNIPETIITKALFPVTDAHSHAYPETKEEVAQWVKNMDDSGIQKTVILSMQTGASFDSLVDIYSEFPGRFELWCGFDYTGYDTPEWPEHALAELERCFKKGAKGVGELGDKGLGLFYSKPVPAYGMHIDDKRMKPLLEKCAELNMPINIHIAEPYWMYMPMDSTNDGLMNAYNWKIDLTKPGILNHQQLITTLENAVKENPKTTFIACHFANCSYNLKIISQMLDKYPNLYADIAARYAETATIPRYMKSFYIKYQDKLLYGTDMGFDKDMYKITFRILESDDEHFYANDMFGYHWSYSGFELPDNVLKKLYGGNFEKITKSQK